MFKTLYLGSLSGIRIYIHWTFWWLTLYVLISGLGDGFRNAISSVGFLFAVFGCVFLHELGHAFSGRWFRVPTQDITLLPIGGLARMGSIPAGPKAEFVIAICGPLVNVAIALLLYLFFPIKLPDSGSFSLTDLSPPTQMFLVNVMLAVFNMLPVYPMDGGRILRALLQFVVSRRTAVLWTGRLGQILAILFAGYGLFTLQFSLFLIFTIMFFACSFELFQNNLKDRMQQVANQMADQLGTNPKGSSFNGGPFSGGPFSTGPFSDDDLGPSTRSTNSEIVDAEDVRRIQ
ncbi:MAG: site-2 protease family protein [Pirellula sp.]|jgi:Zn-dependent protease|nr:site-2 protease family protein [Pirellula sp.]